MKQIVTCKEMKALDGNMIEGIGIPSCVLMERAALKVAEELERTLADKKQEERILCVCGSGNNGGDGVAVARLLYLKGSCPYSETAWLSYKSVSGGESGPQDCGNAASAGYCSCLSGAGCE